MAFLREEKKRGQIFICSLLVGAPGRAPLDRLNKGASCFGVRYHK